VGARVSLVGRCVGFLVMYGSHVWSAFGRNMPVANALRQNSWMLMLFLHARQATALMTVQSQYGVGEDVVLSTVGGAVTGLEEGRCVGAFVAA
jgi:hypothetical protein